ncbi:RimK family alpha-L-glutamate ligase [Streptomyces sp. HU2014]|uniref:RimK family alpha-L-glutamate ligase n=1 Tax=Streptomyces sp. HU2014 TaxID=2939414 RepID=UPI00200CB52E|nr:RimK family alpha-L-glutamate ligase [Streptomyces sp. HU2014]UQI46771.1 RimK family alpha-L-glutamate ligase [Streptomyces sp. HU2014]
MSAAGAVTDGAAGPDAEFWLVVGTGLSGMRIVGELTESCERLLTGRYTVVRTDELLLGVHGGRLTLHDVGGRQLAAPAVAYARMSSAVLSTDREITLLRHLEAMGTALINPTAAVLACVNKFWHLQQLAVAGLPVPDTRSYADVPLSKVIDAGVPEPCVVKSVRGQQGRRVFLAPDAAMLRAVHGSLRDDSPYVFQRYVAHSHGRDLRVIVVDGRAVAAQIRSATDGGLTSNLALGGTAELCLGRHPAGEELAVRAAEVLGLGVAGVDLLFEPDGGFTICEVNVHVGWRACMAEVAPAVVAACRDRLDAAGGAGAGAGPGSAGGAPGPVT